MPPARAVICVTLAALSACAPLPDTRGSGADLPPMPPLLPLDALTGAPAPQATPELAETLAARGAALRQEAAAIE